MKKLFQIILLFYFCNLLAQTDYSTNWEDFYSYNNVKDFTEANNTIYALVDNAIFVYDIESKEISKFSSVNGLTGETTSSIFYSQENNKIIIGYETGMLEIIDKNNNITISNEIENFNYSGSKSINNITEFNNKLYLSTSFAVVVYDIQKLEFGDTYFIGNNSSELVINDIGIFDNQIYAGTASGLYTANLEDPNLIDYSNWTQEVTGAITAVEVFNNQVFYSKGKNLYTASNTLITSLSSNINSLKFSNDYLAISTNNSVHLLDSNLNEIITHTPDIDVTINTSFILEDELYIATDKKGILQSNINTIDDYNEIYPDGPSDNQAFSIAAKENQLWVVYGGYDASYTPLNGHYGWSHYSYGEWFNNDYDDFSVENLVHVTFDYSNTDKVYISSWGASNPNDVSNTGGILVVENNEVVDFWNYTNSELENVYLPAYPNYITTRINGSEFDSQGNLWIANAWVDERVKKYSSNGNWSSFDMAETITNEALGLNELAVDSSNTIWIGSRRNGVLVFNENSGQKLSLTTEVNSGSLPNLNVRTVKVDSSNRVWIGTSQGLVVYYNGYNIFNETIYDAESVIISEDGTAQQLLGDQVVNSIVIDGAENKWFGTSSSGVVQTSPDGTTVLQEFTTSNSPLPSNEITKIAVDTSTGKVYFATANGIVAYDSNVSTYSDSLTEVYAYPNPSTKTNEYITIDGRYDEHLPNGTNVKILDSAGNLVYETNVEEGDELYGGKVVWDKRNLAGRKVASGVYIVLLSANDHTETATTKIAIIN